MEGGGQAKLATEMWVDPCKSISEATFEIQKLKSSFTLIEVCLYRGTCITCDLAPFVCHVFIIIFFATFCVISWVGLNSQLWLKWDLVDKAKTGVVIDFQMFGF